MDMEKNHNHTDDKRGQQIQLLSKTFAYRTGNGYDPSMFHPYARGQFIDGDH
jgi:hypothetical protein